MECVRDLLRVICLFRSTSSMRNVNFVLRQQRFTVAGACSGRMLDMTANMGPQDSPQSKASTRIYFLGYKTVPCPAQIRGQTNFLYQGRFRTKIHYECRWNETLTSLVWLCCRFVTKKCFGNPWPGADSLMTHKKDLRMSKLHQLEATLPPGLGHIYLHKAAQLRPWLSANKMSPDLCK